MKAVFINSKDKTVTDVTLDGRKPMLQQWYKIIGCSTVEVATYINKEDDSILVDEEGLFNLKEDSSFFTYESAHQPFVGNGLIVGVDAEGETVDCHVSAKDVADKVKFLSLSDVRMMNYFK